VTLSINNNEGDMMSRESDQLHEELFIPCLVCENKIKLQRQGDRIIGPIYFNIPAVVCPHCVDDLLDNIVNAPGLSRTEELTLEQACNILESFNFARDIQSSVTFFCDLFAKSPKIYDFGAMRLHSLGYRNEAHGILSLGITKCINNDQLLLEKAAFLDMEGKAEEGLEILQNINDHNLYRYFTIKGNLLKKINRWEEAAECWKESTIQYSEDEVAWRNLGYYFLQVKKDYSTAEKHYTDACNNFPSHRAFHAYLGDSLFFQDKFEDAKQKYEFALTIEDDNPSLLNDIENMIMECDSKISYT
jgi:tetratricopeptide (TPR) repeat protein